MNKEQQQIIDKVYESALIEYGWESLPSTPEGWLETIEHFIHKCKMDNEFYEKWGLKIEERELSLEERSKIWNKTHNPAGNIYTHNQYDENNLPTKLTTITYKEQKIESYNTEGII